MESYVPMFSIGMYAPLSILSRAGQASLFSVPAPQGHIHPGKEHRDVCATREKKELGQLKDELDRAKSLSDPNDLPIRAYCGSTK